jgi:DNA-binding HxlR family transcriptional regulator
VTAEPTPDYPLDQCSIARSLSVLGERWTLLVLREVFHGVRRFDDLHARLGAPRQVLSNRLGQLVDDGFLRREPYREPGQRTRYEYRLTPKGRDLFPILVALLHWGDRYAVGPAGPPISLHHRDCDAEVELALRCGDGHELSGPRDVEIHRHTPRTVAAAAPRRTSGGTDADPA